MASDQFETPAWVDDGMEVFVPYALFCTPEERPAAIENRTGLRCTVAVAAGYHARVVHVGRGVDRWMHINDLRVRRPTAAAQTGE